MTTPRELQVLDYMIAYVVEHRIPPTIEQIALQVGLRSKSSVHRVLRQLEAHGLTERRSLGLGTGRPRYTPHGWWPRMPSLPLQVEVYQRLLRIAEAYRESPAKMVERMLDERSAFTGALVEEALAREPSRA